MRRILFAWFLTILAVHAAERPPNVVFILADDLGWSDTTLFGTTSLYQTPNIERLAKRGMTFRRAYTNSPLCSPTRASMLTGQSVARHGITAPAGHLPKVLLAPVVPKRAKDTAKVIMPDSATRLDTRHHTLGEAFHEAGYATGHFGKWHLGTEPYSPLQHGFDVDLPHDSGPGPRRGFVGVWSYPKLKPRSPDEHIEDRMAEEAMRFIEKNKDRPFYLNYWQFSVHAPFDAKKKLIEKYKGLVKPDDPQRCPTYAAMIESLDDAVGTLLDTLDRNGLTDRTILVFYSDNGGNMYNEVDGTTPTSNRPLRGGKATLWEGGIRVPAIIAWPGVTKAGAASDSLIQTSDFYPTFVDLLGLKPADGQVFDGVSLAGTLRGGKAERDALFVFYPHSPGVPDTLPPGIAMISDEWKLIRLFHDGPDGKDRHLLYHLSEDAGETRDLAASEPDRVASMSASIDRHLAETGALLPKPNPAYRPNAVRGWTSGKYCSTEQSPEGLVIRTKSNDPWVSHRLPQPASGENLSVRLRMKADGGGSGAVMWTAPGSPAFNGKERSAPFEPVFDGKPHTYQVDLPAKKVTGIRIDPGTAPGTYTIKEVAVLRGDKTLWSWPSRK